MFFVSHIDSVKMNGQQKLIVLDFLRSLLQLVHIPIRPDKLALEKFGLGRREPNAKVSRKLNCTD
jgi:hypothetical protein